MTLIAFDGINRRNIVIFILEPKILFEIFLWLQLEVSVLRSFIVLDFTIISVAFLWLGLFAIVKYLGICSLGIFSARLGLSTISVRGRIFFAGLLFQKIFIEVI
jgi:hypothetical protein